MSDGLTAPPSWRRVAYIGAGAVGAVFLASLVGRVSSLDEATFAEHVYWMSKLGYVRDLIWGGLGLGWEERHFHFHKFFILFHTAVAWVAGFHVYTFKVATLAWAVGSGWLVWRYMRSHSTVWQPWVLVAAGALLLWNQYVYFFSFYFRPELMLTFLGLGHFWFLHRWLQAGRWQHLVLSGLLAGLAAFTHLNGLAFVAAGGALLLWRRQLGPAVVFGLLGGAVAALYAYDLLAPGHWETFLYQFRNDFNLSKEDFQWYTPLLKLTAEHQRFFHSPEEVSFSLLVVFCGAIGWRRLRQEQGPLLGYLLFLVMALAGVSHGPRPSYGLIYYPFFAVVVAYGLAALPVAARWQQGLAALLVAAYLVTNGLPNLQTFQHARHYPDHNAAIADHMHPPQASVLGPSTFIWGQIGTRHYQGTTGYKAYHEYYTEEEVSFHNLAEFCQRHELEYVVLDRYQDAELVADLFAPQVDFSSAAVGQRLGPLVVIAAEPDYLILRVP